MKKLTILIVLLCIFSSAAFAQIGINNNGTSADPSAGLDVKYTDKGVLIPRVALVQTSSAAPVTSPALSLLVYNTETINDVSPGYYYWGGTAWIRLSVSNGTSGTTNYVTKWATDGTLGNSQLFDDGTNVGIGTTTPGARLHVNDGNFLITGTYGSGEDIPASGAGTRMYFYPKKGAFRAGHVIGSEWDEANIGAYSTALGYGTIASTANSTALGIYTTASGSCANALGSYSVASGSNSTALGFATAASGNYSTALGTNTIANGIYSTALGQGTIASGYTSIALGAGTMASGMVSTAFGTATTASGDYSTAMGNNTSAKSAYETVIGSSNADYSPVSTDGWDANDRLFSIGNGTAVDNRSNAMTVLKNGNVGIGTTTPGAKLDVAGTVKIADGTQGADKVLTSDANGLASWQASSQNAWSLQGNSGTTEGTNFIGTADNKYLSFRTNNAEKLRLTTKGALETYNTGHSVFIGEGAGAADDLSDNANIFIGYEAGKANTTGSFNTANGMEALSFNTVGSFNTANGSAALYSNTNGNANTANGEIALYHNTTGTFNTANGSSALYYNTNGNSNTANGYVALYFNTNGYGNTANGYYTLNHNTTGSFNTAIGSYADIATNNLSNATAIGAYALAGADNCLVLGSINGVNGASASVDVGIGTTTPDKKLDISGEMQATGTGNNYFAGNVGIGTPNPATKLDVSGGNASFARFGPNSWTNYLVVGAGTNQSNASTAQVIATDNLHLDPASAGHIYISHFQQTDTYINPGAGNVGIGTTTPGAKLDVAGRIWQTNTGHSVFLGESAGAVDDLSDNQNTFAGYMAGNANTEGAGNVALGVNALKSSTIRGDLVAIGKDALKLCNGTSTSSPWEGDKNTAIGSGSLQNNNIGGYNTATGYLTLGSNTTGSNNTAFGVNALISNTTGSYNTAIGNDANVSSGTLTNAMAIGNGAIVNASNKIVLGNASAITVGGYGAWTNYSDIRFKENILYKNDLGLDFIVKLKTASYNYISDQNKRRRDGLIAQDVQQALKELGLEFSGLVIDDDEMKTMNLSYGEFVIPLINATQELSSELKEAQAKIEALEKEKSEMKAQIDRINAYLEISSQK